MGFRLVVTFFVVEDHLKALKLILRSLKKSQIQISAIIGKRELFFIFSLG